MGLDPCFPALAYLLQQPRPPRYRRPPCPVHAHVRARACPLLCPVAFKWPSPSLLRRIPHLHHSTALAFVRLSRALASPSPCARTASQTSPCLSMHSLHRARRKPYCNDFRDAHSDTADATTSYFLLDTSPLPASLCFKPHPRTAIPAVPCLCSILAARRPTQIVPPHCYK